ncbi:MAG: zinc-dependent alcohol dehydrogenase [Planctomycetota bacterium]
MKVVAVSSPGELEIQEIPIPHYNEYQVLVKQLSCSLCNSTDLNIIQGKYKGLKNYPLVLGHEGVGRVIEKGNRVRNFQVGDTVLHTQLDLTDDLMMLPGEKLLYTGWGGFAEYTLATDWRAMDADGIGPQNPRFKPVYYAQRVVQFDLDPILAPALITWREVLSAMKQFGFTANTSIVVFGDGPVGLSMAMFCKLQGMYPVILCGHYQHRLELALKLGADVVINTNGQEPIDAVRKLLPNGCDFVVDAVGNTEIVDSALRLIKHGGTVLIYGIVRQDSFSFNIEHGRVPGNFRIQSYQEESMLETGEAHQQVENLLQLGCIDPKDFVTHVIPLERIREGVEIVQRREGLKVVIAFE